MSKWLMTIASFAGAALFAFAQGIPQTRNWVAGISGIDQITGIHVYNLLASNGIPCAMEGSVAYGIEILGPQTNEVFQILKKDAQVRGYSIWFGERDIVNRHRRRNSFHV